MSDEDLHHTVMELRAARRQLLRVAVEVRRSVGTIDTLLHELAEAQRRPQGDGATPLAGCEDVHLRRN